MTTRPTPLKLNEDLIQSLRKDGVIQGVVTIHLFLKNAKEAAAKSAATVFQGLEQYYWVVESKDDCSHLIDADFDRISPHHIEELNDISITHKASNREPFELDGRGTIVFNLGKGIKIECEVKRVKGIAKLRINDVSNPVGKIAITPEASNVVCITSQSLFD